MVLGPRGSCEKLCPGALFRLALASGPERGRGLHPSSSSLDRRARRLRLCTGLAPQDPLCPCPVGPSAGLTFRHSPHFPFLGALCQVTVIDGTSFGCIFRPVCREVLSVCLCACVHPAILLEVMYVHSPLNTHGVSGLVQWDEAAQTSRLKQDIWSASLGRASALNRGSGGPTLLLAAWGETADEKVGGEPQRGWMWDLVRSLSSPRFQTVPGPRRLDGGGKDWAASPRSWGGDGPALRSPTACWAGALCLTRVLVVEGLPRPTAALCLVASVCFGKRK